MDGEAFFHDVRFHWREDQGLIGEKGSSVREELILSEQEKKIIEILRGIRYGEIKIAVQDGIPVRVDEIRKSIKI